MRLIGALLVALSVAAAGCASSGGGKAATPAPRTDQPTASTSEVETPTSGPVVTPTAGGSGWRHVYVSERRLDRPRRRAALRQALGRPDLERGAAPR
ncbi:hypothetical protein ABZ297_14095 [Nonomuraea sp. NPDC005983]|uniref:hypothetical protein n=1 Tax=Nonomuraea sp. NPDC005983 TaxID=3155595 RepID=UPI0033AA0954